jgi:nucleotidyltransferase-like protein
MLTATDLQRVADFLEERFGLDTLWLFGSEALGTSRPNSDVDLAALFHRRPNERRNRPAPFRVILPGSGRGQGPAFRMVFASQYGSAAGALAEPDQRGPQP